MPQLLACHAALLRSTRAPYPLDTMYSQPCQRTRSYALTIIATISSIKFHPLFVAENTRQRLPFAGAKEWRTSGTLPHEWATMFPYYGQNESCRRVRFAAKKR